ncbi:hypothetical protein [Gordonia caeni]|uniref:LGFP repeat protein n=1 Tax=Gordonia caeni TaxID=1007097 RepID=A0ABP7PM75_9ACTN
MSSVGGRLVRPSIVVIAVVSLLLAALAGAPATRADARTDAAAAIDAYAAQPQHSADLGAPTGEVRSVAGGGAQTFENGTVYYSAETGAHAVLGRIAVRYRAVGGPAAIGFPTGDEQAVGEGRYSEFSAPGGAAIYWSPQTRASLLTGAVLRAWQASGGVEGPFGYPTSDTSYTGRFDEASFAGSEGTQIEWSSTAGLTTVPAELADTMPQMAQAARETVAPSPVADRTRSGDDDQWWQPWWQWLIVAAALLILLIALGLILRLGSKRKAARAHGTDVRSGGAAPGKAAVPAAAASATGARTKTKATTKTKAKTKTKTKAKTKAKGETEIKDKTETTDADHEVVAAAAAEAEPEPAPEPEPVALLSDETALASEIVVAYSSDSDAGLQVAYENNALGGDRSSSDDATHAWLHGAEEREDGETEDEESAEAEEHPAEDVTPEDDSAEDDSAAAERE